MMLCALTSVRRLVLRKGSRRLMSLICTSTTGTSLSATASRNATLVWVDLDGKSKEFSLGADPRNWHPGWHVVSASFTPTSAKGTLYLSLSDPLLQGRPEYSIALANEGVFDSSTGLNKLFEIK